MHALIARCLFNLSSDFFSLVSGALRLRASDSSFHQSDGGFSIMACTQRVNQTLSASCAIMSSEGLRKSTCAKMMARLEASIEFSLAHLLTLLRKLSTCRNDLCSSSGTSEISACNLGASKGAMNVCERELKTREREKGEETK